MAIHYFIKYTQLRNLLKYDCVTKIDKVLNYIFDQLEYLLKIKVVSEITSHLDHRNNHQRE